VGHKQPWVRLAPAPDRKTLVSLGGDETVRLWDAVTGKELHCLQHDAREVAFSPDGKTVASGGSDGFIRLWDTATGKEVRHWKTNHSIVWTVAFSADGKYLASAGGSRVIGLWETSTGRALPPLVGHRGKVVRLVFSPNGKLLASTGQDTTVLLWDVERLFRERRGPTVRFAPEELEISWWDLGAPEPWKVRQARDLLCAGGAQTVSLLQRCLPEAAAETARMEQFIADLDSDAFKVREEATAALEKLGTAAGPALRKAEEKPISPEARRRVEMLLAKLEDKDGPRDVSRVRRPLEALAVLEWIDSPEARQLLKEVAKGPPAADVTKEASAILKRLAARDGAKP